ncbi:MAG TPA: zinc-dependent metalloprotease [Acidimicrobiales bacterium]
MSVPGPFGSGNPFEGMPIFGDLARMFQAQGPVNWDVARQIGSYMAAQGEPEANVDPLVRISFEELARVAELHVANRTGLDTTVGGKPLTVRPANRSTWAETTLDAYRPLFETLAGALGSGGMPAGMEARIEGDENAEISEELLGNMLQVMAPTILGMQLGLMTGHLARRSLGQYDLPVPRPPRDELVVVAANLERFASDWSLPPDDVRLWVCLDNITHAAVLGRTHVRETLLQLLETYAGGFRPDPEALSSRLETIDPSDAQSWENAFGDPRALLGSMETDEQRAVKPRLEALTVTIEGYVDYILDSVGTGLIGSYGPLAEALRRRRVEANAGDRFVEQLFGLELSQKQYDRGEAFVRGIVERAGEDGLARLWSEPRHLPTPAEVDAPGLWLERISLPDD